MRHTSQILPELWRSDPNNTARSADEPGPPAVAGAPGGAAGDKPAVVGAGEGDQRPVRGQGQRQLRAGPALRVIGRPLEDQRDRVMAAEGEVPGEAGAGPDQLNAAIRGRVTWQHGQPAAAQPPTDQGGDLLVILRVCYGQPSGPSGGVDEAGRPVDGVLAQRR